MKKIVYLFILVLLSNFTQAQTLVAHFPMDLDAGKTKISEVISGKTYTVNNAKPIRENIAGALGQALRFDGYSTYVNAQFNSNNLSDQAISVEMWVALENYPMMNTDRTNSDYAYIAGNMKSSYNSGFAVVVNTYGQYAFQIYVDGNLYTCTAGVALPRFEWVHIQAVVNTANHKITLYHNGRKTGEVSFAGSSINVGTKPIIIGKSYTDITTGNNFLLNTICGLVDEIKIYSGALPAPSNTPSPENNADLTIPSIRFEDDIQRPRLHGMPAAGWANEPHGLIYRNGKYHIFFQKNGRGPYWGQIEWGHIISEDLANWEEHRPSITLGNTYDVKGAWSGCIFTDELLNGGKPTIFYTAADFSKASIVSAVPQDVNLINWSKTAQVISQRPSGLSDDFRDPAVFKANGTLYMIIGTSKDGKGTTVLYSYNTTTQNWDYKNLFFQASSTSYGTFWEMPYVIEIASGKWMFVVTPLGMNGGVQAVYWIGTINSDGSFNPSHSSPKKVELGDMSKEGHGLLSPSIMQKDGKTIAIGIAPDCYGETHSQGWTHTFTLPREWTLDNQNNLVQKPFEGLKALRSNEMLYSRDNFTLNGTQSLNPVSGRILELEAEFTVSAETTQQFGFNLRKNGEQAIKIYYQKSTNKLVLDATNVPRIINDAGVFDGYYSTVLPKTFDTNENIKLHIFSDNSIFDIFVNDTWACSIRLFPTDVNATDVEVFSNGNTSVQSLKAWNLTYNSSTSASVTIPVSSDKNIFYRNNHLHFENISEDAHVAIYDLYGRLVSEKKNYYLHTGMFYIVMVNDKGEIITKKIIAY